jgi:hypothetical protein
MTRIQGQELGPSARIYRKRERRWLAQLVAGNESQVYTLLVPVTTFVSGITDAGESVQNSTDKPMGLPPH